MNIELNNQQIQTILDMLKTKPEYDNFTNTIVGQIREKLIDAKLYE